MTVRDIDTSAFLADPSSQDFLNKLEKYTEFQWPEQLKNRKTEAFFTYDKQQICTYISLTYDLKSSLIRDFPFTPHRKYHVALMVGWQKDNKTDRFDPDVEAILLGDVLEVANAIVKYCMLQNVPEYMVLESSTSMFAAANADALSGRYDKDMFKLIGDLRTSMEKSQKLLFNGEEAMSMREALYASIEQNRLGLKPEDIAQKLSANEDPLPDVHPYGEDYTIDARNDIRFIGDR